MLQCKPPRQQFYRKDEKHQKKDNYILLTSIKRSLPTREFFTKTKTFAWEHH